MNNLNVRPLPRCQSGRPLRRAAITALILSVGVLLTACQGGSNAQPGPIAGPSAVLSSGGPTAIASWLSPVAATPGSSAELSELPTSASTGMTTAVGQPPTPIEPTNPDLPLGGADQGSAATTSQVTTAAATTADAASYGSAADGYYWSSPSGNIDCYAQDGTVYCGAIQHSFAYQGSNCPLDAEGVEIKPGFMVEVTCGGDPPQNIRALAYRQRIIVGTVTCDSETSGMICVDAAHGDGFTINRSDITILPNGDHPLPYQPNSGRPRSPSPTSDTTPHTAPPAPTKPAGLLTAQYTGSWQAHDALLSITASGTATAVYRTYTWCAAGVAPPCDSMVGDSITPGGHVVVAVGAVVNAVASGRVRSSDDPIYPVGSAFPMKWSGTSLETPIDFFCRAAGSSTCGA